MEEYDAQIGKLDYEKKLQEDSLNDTREQEADAQTRYQAAQSEQKSIIDSIQIPRKYKVHCVLYSPDANRGRDLHTRGY